VKGAILIAVAAAVLASAEARITYSKTFKGSQPPFVSIELDKSGHAVYKEAPDDPNPMEVQVPPGDVAVVFDLAAKLDHFARPLESHLKVAYTGEKKFVWEDGSEKHETAFNYSLNLDARQLADWFEKFSETEQRWEDLDRTFHFDKLGVNDAVLQINILYDRKRLIAPQQFVPLLERVSKDENIVHIARERAASLVDQFQKQSSSAPAATP